LELEQPNFAGWSLVAFNVAHYLLPVGRKWGA